MPSIKPSLRDALPVQNSPVKILFFSGSLITSGELQVNQFFSFLAAMMLAYQPIRSLATINMAIYQGATAFKRISDIIDKDIEIKNDENLPKLEIKKSNLLK